MADESPPNGESETREITLPFNLLDASLDGRELDYLTVEELGELPDLHLKEVIANVRVAARALKLRDVQIAVTKGDEWPYTLRATAVLTGTRHFRLNGVPVDTRLDQLRQRLEDNIHQAVTHGLLELPEAEQAE